MKILVHAPSVAGRPRLVNAAIGLAMRGHRVLWSGGPLPAHPTGLLPGTLEGVAGGLAATRVDSDLAIGGAQAVRAVALAAALAHARCAVLEFGGDEWGRWSALDRLSWSTIDGWGLVDDAAAARLHVAPGDLALDRFGLWPDDAPAASPDAAHADTEVLERACERALARHGGHLPRSAVFLDRDGTLIVERGYLDDPAGVELLPGVPAALQNLRAAGHPIVVLSNQSGVARGKFPLSRVHEVMAMLRLQLRRHGVELDAIYFCPHHPDAGCRCRKPGIELLERAAEDLVLDLPSSVVIGDKRLDVETARNAHAIGILVRTGYGREQERMAASGDVTPAHVADDLGSAVDWLLAREGLGTL